MFKVYFFFVPSGSSEFQEICGLEDRFRIGLQILSLSLKHHTQVKVVGVKLSVASSSADHYLQPISAEVKKSLQNTVRQTQEKKREPKPIH